MRPTLRLAADLEPGFKVVAEANGAEEAWQHLERNPEVDLALVDIHMRGINGIGLTEKIHAHFPRVAIVIPSNEDRGGIHKASEKGRCARLCVKGNALARYRIHHSGYHR